MFPISLWVPHEYPRIVPIAFVTPTKTMAVRTGQYVSAEGRIYHPYLAAWRQDVSSLNGKEMQKISVGFSRWITWISSSRVSVMADRKNIAIKYLRILVYIARSIRARAACNS